MFLPNVASESESISCFLISESLETSTLHKARDYREMDGDAFSVKGDNCDLHWRWAGNW